MTQSSNPAPCDIIIPIWNQPNLTDRCLKSLLASGESGLRLILVDNGSGDPTQELLDRFRSESPVPVEILRNISNLGFIKAVNQGIRASRNPWVCLLNNDTVTTRGWLSEMIRVAESDPRIGLVNPTSNSLGFRPGRLPIDAYAEELRSQSGRWSELSTALGFCLLARRCLFDRIGLLDESYGMGNFDDDDLSKRIRAEGLMPVRACGAYVYHEEKASFRKLPGWEKEFEKNRRIFEARWGRSLRILWVVPPGTSPPLETALELSRQGHWITWMSVLDALPESIRSQAQVSQVPVTARNWRWKTLLRLMMKRKKPFHLAVCQEEQWRRQAGRLGLFHSARILPSANPRELLQECQALSRSQ